MKKKNPYFLFICIHILVKFNVFAVSLNSSINRGSSNFKMQEINISFYATRPVLGISHQRFESYIKV